MIYNILKINLLLLTLFLVSCDETNLPDEVDGEVLFFLDGTLNNKPLIINAGEDNFYLYTNYQVDNNGLLHFEGNFAKTNACIENCDEALRISISNNIPGLGFNINDALFVGDYRLASQQIDSTTLYETTFQASGVGNSTITANWDFGDGNTSTNLHPVYDFQSSNPIVQLEITDLFGCKSLARSQLDLDNNSFCQQDFFFSYNPSLSIYSFIPFGGYQSSNTYQWRIVSESDSLQSSNSTFTTAVNANGQFQVCLTTTSSSGCISEICKSFDAATSTLSCAAAFQFDAQPRVEVVNSQIFSNVEIAYTSPDNVLFTNKNGNQPSTNNSYFRIINISDYEINENGQLTKKIIAEMNCVLFDNNGNELVLNSSNFVFAVALP